ncbi:hypothetical protein BC629DRAFT_677601 [Irpex lacteus]|nr:hypothetical protein BC629DRAFT_677601 [Irpex lacteus]
MPAHNAAGQNRNMVSRSNSLLGTIKNILPAKLPWFGASSDQADTPSKRKQEEERLDVEEGTRSNKRQRMGEELGELGEIRRVPDAAQPRLQPSAAGYLDPPQRLLGEATTVNVPRASPLHTRASSVAAPSRSTRRTGMSPALGGPRYQTMRISRTQSMDPPKRYRSASYKPVLSPMPISRDASMEDLSFEDSPPSPAKPFRMRTSLTPQLPDLDISGGHNERDSSEPPLVDELVDKPVFVRAPSEAPRQATPLARSGSLTLGAVVEARKQAKPLQRSHSSLMIGGESSSMQDIQSTSSKPPAEKALRELDVYKTPLLPTRLRGSNTVPEMFRSKRGKAPLLMHDREDKPRLGTVDKSGVLIRGDESPSTKPYAGSGGMRKLLAKRRLEEEEEEERAKASSMDSDVEEETRKTANELGSKLVAELQPASSAKEPEPAAAVSSIGGREQPSLRVGRTRTSRNHIARPMMRGRPGRFSAIAEEEEDDSMGEIPQPKANRFGEPPKVAPAQPPTGFSFAKDTAAPKIDSGDSQEAPILSLPFSFAKPSTPSAAAGSSSTKADKPTFLSLPAGFSPSAVATTPPATVAANSSTVSAPAPSTPLLASVPEIALVSASPSPAASKQDVSKSEPISSTSAVPNFFANSALLSKSSTSPSPAPLFNLTGSNTNASNLKPASSFFAPLGENKAASEEQPSIFGASNKLPQLSFGAASSAPTSAFPLFGATAASTSTAESAKDKEQVAAPVPVAASPFGFGTPTKPAAKPAPPALPFAFGTPSKPAETASPSPSPAPFAFGTPVKVAEPAVAPPASSPAPFAFSTPTKSSAPAAASTPFAFGTPAKADAPKSDAGSRPQTAEAPKPLFGAAPATPQSSAPGPFTFGTPTKVEASKSDAGSRPTTAEAPKPIFGGGSGGGFTFGQPSSNTTAPAPAKSPFAFGAAPATPSNENKPFTFGTPTAAPSTPAAFGTPTTTNGADASKPFAFGSGAPAREVTPPKREDSEVMMDESPVRPPTELSSRPELPKLNAGGFSFNLPGASSSPFGQSPQTTNGFPFSSQPPASSTLFGAKTETKPAEKPAASAFGFGQSTAPSTGFAFGAPKPAESNTPAHVSGFNFSTPAPTPTAASAPFGFSAPQISQSNSFGSNAAPASPFGQPTGNTGFAFGAGTTPTATTSPFTFTGSQPASPAATNAGLPAQNGSTGGFTFGAPSAAAPAAASSPFAAPAALPEPGGTLFTMGAAPPAGQRQLKGLPKRRPQKR